MLRITFYCFFNQPDGEILLPVLFLAETPTVLSRSRRASLLRFWHVHYFYVGDFTLGA